MKVKIYLFLLLLLCTTHVIAGNDLENLEKLKQAYPAYIKAINTEYITWYDGDKMSVIDDNPNQTPEEKLDEPSLADQLEQSDYPGGKMNSSFRPSGDPGRIRYEPFFQKMYGYNESEVRKNITRIYWMPKIFGKRYQVPVTKVNHVDKKLAQVSAELEELVMRRPEYAIYLDNPGGGFFWRSVANTHRLSPHSYGISIDINAKHSNYWLWDLKRRHLPVKETTPITYANQVPWEIVEIFERNGFIWGGKWYHYDTMHFEYRPELLQK